MQDHQWFKYVAHGAIAEYEARGWRVSDRMEDLHHGDHGVLMKWAGEGEPRMKWMDEGEPK